MKYGLPYKGSKNKLAEKIVDLLKQSGINSKQKVIVKLGGE